MSPAAPSVMPVAFLAMLLALGAGGAWQWQRTVFQAKRIELTSESWDRVKQDYPMAESAPSTEWPADVAEAVLKANPFSPQRRPVAAKGEGGAEGGSLPTPAPPKPQFAFKGQINLGQRKRAILEDLSAHKTYFLEVGQEVAGFKVLDIGENQVVLSDPQTREEVAVSLASSDKAKKKQSGETQ